MDGLEDRDDVDGLEDRDDVDGLEDRDDMDRLETGRGWTEKGAMPWTTSAPREFDFQSLGGAGAPSCTTTTITTTTTTTILYPDEHDITRCMTNIDS